MDQLIGLRVFREVVEAGSFTAAAKRLGLSAPMASKHVAQLERRLRTRLLHRSSRHLSLTEAGSAYYEPCRQALDTLDAADAAAGETAGTVRGPLKISAPVWCANAAFAEALARFCARFPEVLIDLRLENRRIDLAAEGYDLALRATHEPSSALIARPLCPIDFHLVATPAFRDRLPRDVEPPVIDAVVPSYVDIGSIRAPNERRRVQLHAVLRSDDTTLTRHAVLAGIGASLLPHWVIEEDLRTGRLVPLLGESFKPYSITLFAVYVSRKHMPPKLRCFIDFMADALAPAGAPALTRAALAAQR